MEIELPAIPAGVVTLIGLLSPYLIAIINSPRWSKTHKKIISISASLVLAGIALLGYYVVTQEPIPSIPMLIILGILVTQFSYAILTKTTVKNIEKNVGVG